MWTNIKTSYKFLNFFDNFDNHNGNTKIHTRTHTKLPIIIFFWNFEIVPWNTSFLPQFPSAYKTRHICASSYNQVSICSKHSWIDISTMHSFYRWLFSSMVPCRTVSEYWSQVILSWTQSYRNKCYQWFF